MYRETHERCRSQCDKQCRSVLLGLKITPSSIQHLPSSSAPACDSEWSLHQQNKRLNWWNLKPNHRSDYTAVVRGLHALIV